MSVLSKLTFQIAAQGSAQVKKELAEVDRRASEAGGKIKNAFSEKVALGFAASATAALVKVGMEFDQFLERYDELGKLATRTGLDVKAIDQFRILENLTGQATANLARAFNFFQRQIGEGKVNVFEQMLGLDSTGTVEQRFRALLDELSKIDPGDPQKNVLVNKLFGEDSGREMLRMLNAGELGLKDMLAVSEELANADEEMVRSVEALNDRMTVLNESFNNMMEEDVFAKMAESANLLVKALQRVAEAADSVGGVGNFSGISQGLGNLGIFNTVTTMRTANRSIRDLKEAFGTGDKDLIGEMAYKARKAIEENIVSSDAFGFGDKARSSWKDQLEMIDRVLENYVNKRIEDTSNLLSDDLYANEQYRTVTPVDPLIAFQEAMDREKAANNDYWNTVSTQARPQGAMDAVTGLFESEMEKLRKELSETLEQVAMLPEAEVWSNVLKDLRDGNSILMSIDGSLQIIKQKNPLSLEVVK